MNNSLSTLILNMALHFSNWINVNAPKQIQTAAKLRAHNGHVIGIANEFGEFAQIYKKFLINLLYVDSIYMNV